MRVLVAVASKHDATAEIASAISHTLAQRGLPADVKSPEDVGDLEGYDAVILGSAVYYGKWQGSATEFAERHLAALAARPVWLFSSGPVGSPVVKPEGDPVGTAELVAAVNARGHRVFAGRIDRRRLGIAEKAIVAAVRAQEGDFRDWDAIATWAGDIADALAAQPIASGAS